MENIKNYNYNAYPRKNEQFYDYRERITKNKKELNLTWEDIKYLCKFFYNEKVSDNWRKVCYGMREKEEVENQRDNKTKVLIMNDIHIPYQRKDILDEVKKYKNIDYLVIGGDLIDCESCSSFPVMKRPSVEQELTLAYNFIQEINKIINPQKTKIICISGNHEERYQREIIKMQEKSLQKMLNPKLLSMIQEGFSYYDDDKKYQYAPINNFEYIDSWQSKLFGNLIICHPKNFSVVQGKVAEMAAAYFLNQGIAEKGDILVVGHTHKFGIYANMRNQGLFAIENGCLCEPMSYASNGKLNFTPQNYCYTYLEFEEGKKINPNDIKVIHLE